MSGTLKFSDLTKAVEETDLQEEKKGIEIEIEVAGPKEMKVRHVKMSLDNRGLIKLCFREGGKLPVLLQGRFTSIEDVKVALAVWQDREAKHFHVEDKIESDNSEGQSVSDLVDNAVQTSAPPAFDEKLDDVLATADEEVDLSDEDDNDIVSLA
jgi:hypothetical protein